MNKPMKRKINFRVLGRVLKLLFSSYPVMVPLSLLFVVFTAFTSAIPALFMQKVFEIIGAYEESGDFAMALGEILPKIILLASIVYTVEISTTTLIQKLLKTS